jgi:hypothetical protein
VNGARSGRKLYLFATALLQDCANVASSKVTEIAFSGSRRPAAAENNVFCFF